LRYTVRPATVLDIYCLSHAFKDRFEIASAHEVSVRERLIQAWNVSESWLVVDAEGKPTALLGAAPKAGEPDVGVLWMVFLAAFNSNEDHAVVHLVTDALLERYWQIENYVDARKTWALDLLRAAGFTVEHAAPVSSGEARYRVWRESHAQRTVAH
jgi:hypothetical protein